MGSVPGDSNVQSRLKTSCIKDILCSLRRRHWDSTYDHLDSKPPSHCGAKGDSHQQAHCL